MMGKLREIRVHAATALRPEECFALKWCDILRASNQILVQRAWSKGKLTNGKTSGSMKPVVMHPALADYLSDWRGESLYSKDSDWVSLLFVPRGGFHGRRHLVERIIYVRLRSRQGSSLWMINLDLAGITFDTAWRLSLARTRSTPRSSRQCSAMRSSRRPLATFIP